MIKTALLLAVGYIRMSTDQQVDSPQRQRAEIETLVARPWPIDDLNHLFASARRMPGEVAGIPARRWWPALLPAGSSRPWSDSTGHTMNRDSSRNGMSAGDCKSCKAAKLA